MIVDLILDRKDGAKYSPKTFYNDCMGYGVIGDDITRAMDKESEKQIKQALNEYILHNEYNEEICDYINETKWL